MRNKIEIIKQNTITMSKIYSTEMSIANKLALVNQLYSNLAFLKKELDSSEYEEEFSSIEKEVIGKIKNLTEPAFVEKLLSSIKKLSKIDLK